MGISIKNSLKGISPKKILLIILGIALGIILLSFGGGITEASEKKVQGNDGEGIYYSEILEDKVEDFLMTVEGIDEVRVFITVDGSKEYEYAKKGGAESYAVDFLIINNKNGEEAAVVREIYPQIRGIAVSCTNGDRATVKEKITTLLSAGLGISVNKINVVGN
ncbi:MAG: hypothetical protein E7578_05620 [Ruminococcaceae bacterium]|nr:hypothetical protein [Oscillospiraceae bacterium]